VKDRDFTGKDVAEALRMAAETLGLPQAALQYFVLDPGRPGGLGVTPSPARIAVLMEASAGPRTPAAKPAVVPAAEDWDEGEDLLTHVQSVVRSLGRAAGFDLDAEVEEQGETAVIRLVGSDPAFFLGPRGDGDVRRAIEHLLHRMYALDFAPCKLRVEVAGYREQRDRALERRAQLLVEEVKRGREPRETEPLNAYERRIVHMAVAAAGGVVSRSVGEGASRRVTIAIASDNDGPGGEVH
jgi:spoIIIJ-associated protein